MNNLNRGQILGQGFTTASFSGVLGDDNSFIAAHGLDRIVGTEQLRLIMIDCRKRFALATEQLAFQQANHLLQMVILRPQRQDDLLERLGVIG